MKNALFLLLLICLSFGGYAQNIPAGNVASKNYYLLTQLANNPASTKLLAGDAVLRDLLKSKITGIRAALTNCKEPGCFTGPLKFSDAEIQTISTRLRALYQSGNALGKVMTTKIVPSGAYSLYDQLAPKELLVKAWEQDAAGINHTIAVYAEGKKPNYPAVDSIDFKVHDKTYADLLNKATATLLDETENSSLFFIPEMKAALLFLDLNNRNDAASYEPMATTVNRAALTKAKTINWAQYPYTLIMVPGQGPEENGVAIAPEGKLRCRLAAVQYLKGAAPFIMVSGGKVHPYKTAYCEAEEMKNYLVHELNIPESAIIMEPHARHTTTNMRNAVRLIYQYHLPVNKAAVVISDQSQSAYISGMAGRCMKELNCVPYKLGTRLSATGQEFYPVWQAMQINALEPLDP
ncbi:MAG: YdcF family protein [Mucilaginibacter sp.]